MKTKRWQSFWHRSAVICFIRFVHFCLIRFVHFSSTNILPLLCKNWPFSILNLLHVNLKLFLLGMQCCGETFWDVISLVIFFKSTWLIFSHDLRKSSLMKTAQEKQKLALKIVLIFSFYKVIRISTTIYYSFLILGVLDFCK